jgi:hypothetical protein
VGRSSRRHPPDGDDQYIATPTEEPDMQHTTGMAAMIRSIAWDLGLPVVTYYGLHAAGATDTAALLAGTLAAALRMVWVAARSRTISPFSLVMGATFGVGLLFTLLTGDPRIMLVKHSAMAAVVGVTFLVTAFRGGRPLTLAAQQSFQPAKAKELADEYATTPAVRHGHRIASLVWGGGLLTEAAVRIVLIYSLPVSVMVGLSTALTVVTFATLIAWNARYLATHSHQTTPAGSASPTAPASLSDLTGPASTSHPASMVSPAHAAAVAAM